MASIDKVVIYGSKEYKQKFVSEIRKAIPSLKKYHSNMYLCDEYLWNNEEWMSNNYGIYLFHNLSKGQYLNIYNTLVQIGCPILADIIAKEIQ